MSAIAYIDAPKLAAIMGKQSPKEEEPEPESMDEPLRLDRDRQLVEEARERDRL